MINPEQKLTSLTKLLELTTAHMAIPQLLALKGTLARNYNDQLAIVNKALHDKGFVPPHLEGALNHGRE